jgi:hypothetical protein
MKAPVWIAQEAVLLRDNESYGIYPFPVAAVIPEAPPGETAWHQTWLHTVELVGDKARVTTPGQGLPNARDFRPLRFPKGAVAGWTVTSANAAFAFLLEALPNFWLNRYRLKTGILAAIHNGTPMNIDGDEKRTRQRELLAQHANSLKMKMWALQYHRGNFLAAIADCKARPTESLYHLTKASAEFTAHDNESYAMLDEFARVRSILSAIRTGVDGPSSFHDLHKAAHKQPKELADILKEMDWYEAFRMRRANSTHAFKAYSTVDALSEDVVLWQHPERSIFTEPGLNLNGDLAAGVFAKLVDGFDRAWVKLSIHLLGQFHPFDTVTMNIKETVEAPTKVLTVWVRRILFSKEYDSGWLGHALLDANGKVHVQIGANGGLKIGPRDSGDVTEIAQPGDRRTDR